MKNLLHGLLIIACLVAIKVQAQSVTNLTITSIIQLDNGLSFTNTASTANTNVIIAATNAMVKLNLDRASQDPPKPATTNLSQFFVEFTKAQFKQYTNDYDFKIVTDLSAALPTLADTNKFKIRQILGTP